MKSLSLYKDNNPEKPGHEYGKTIFDSDLEMVCNVDSNHNTTKDYEIESIKYILMIKTYMTFLSKVTTHFGDCNPFKFNLNLTDVRQLMQQYIHISKIVTKCKSKKYDKPLLSGQTWCGI